MKMRYLKRFLDLKVKVWHAMAAIAVCCFSLTSCVDEIDNPTEPVNPNPPVDKSLWAMFDTWKTDSCTAADDFWMHMLGTWRHKQDLWPGGMQDEAENVADKIAEDGKMDPDYKHLADNVDNTKIYSDDELKAYATGIVNDILQNASTREEAIKAVARMWAEGYTLDRGPKILQCVGTLSWILGPRDPYYYDDKYISEYQNKTNSERQREEAEYKAQVMRMKVAKTRGSDEMSSDMKLFLENLDLGVDDLSEVTITDQVESELKEMFDTITATNVRNIIMENVMLIDGALVNENYAKKYHSKTHGYYDFKKAEPAFTTKTAREGVLKTVGAIYQLREGARKNVSDADIKKYAKWFDEFREAFRQRLAKNEWLSETTRTKALEKLDVMLCYLVQPDYPACAQPVLKGSNILDDMKQLRKARMDTYRWALKQTRERASFVVNCMDWLMPLRLLDDNASFLPSQNYVKVHAANLLMPYVDGEYDLAMQYAIVASAIGHEMTHGFDNIGSMYNKFGDKEDWWTAADKANFETRCENLVKRYDELIAVPWEDPNFHALGKQTLAENIADLGGCNIGLDLLLSHYPDASAEDIKELKRRYFQGWAIVWGKVYGLAYYKEEMIEGKDNHSQFRERVNGVVRNMDGWYDAYDITKGTLYLAPADRVKIW